ncbi:ATPase involved in DNA repair [Bacteroidales bacterium Barb4]|nr:ATPase involved in DNA repair [Bacteroidales bacterium Barb4]
MMSVKPTLFLNRLIVRTHNNQIAYDEKFHNGVNIIRGQNSSGKSTISNFIFYVLGGDFKNWTTEALRCKEVIAEVKINDAIITIKREIKNVGLQPMSIFWNNYEESKNDSMNWQTFPYKQTANVTSYTNVLFKALSFPEVKSEENSNITIHQILRLLYIDQETPTQRLFRLEQFDLPLTKEAISEILLGVYDDSLYSHRLRLKQAKKETEEKEKEFQNLNKVFGQATGVNTVSAVQKEIETNKKSLSGINIGIVELKKQQIIRTTVKTPLGSENIQSELSEAKNKIRVLQTSINQLDIEISDSQQFIFTLEKRISELNNSLLTRQILGELPLTHCPQCLNELDINVPEGHCILCKQPLAQEAEKAIAKRMLQEMDLQVKESKSLLEKKERERATHCGELPLHIEMARSLQKQLDLSVDNPQSTRDERIDDLLVGKGKIERNIEYLTQQLQAVELIDLLKQELAKLASEISIIELEIAQKEFQQKNKRQIAMQEIRKVALDILKKDLERQAEFRNGKWVEIDFNRDIYSLDGNYNFSASSNVYLKNAILFSIFFASIQLDFFRYPRFVLCDNMEDKGMEKERTQNLQNILINISSEIKEEHQIIFTTSMIADNLNNTPYCVGAAYDRNNKTLKV